MTIVEISKSGKNALFILMGFWITYLLAFSLGSAFNSTIAQFIGVQSEYTLGEQLSKLYLLVIIQVAFVGYLSGNSIQKVKLSISFLLLGLVLYLAESNMISEEVQPFFGLVLLALVSYYLIRLRNWLSLSFIAFGIAAIVGGSMLDRLGETNPENLNTLLQVLSSLLNSLSFSEEQFDLLGVASCCLAAILSEQKPLESFFRRANKELVLAVLGTVLIAFGNGFIHFEYKPAAKLYLGALVMSLVGFIMLAFVIKKISLKWVPLQNFSPSIVWSFLFVFFVLLPATYGGVRPISSFLLWLPTFTFMAWCLWTKHPIANESLASADTPVHPFG
ncbi:MAG: hypothetical protein Kow00121_62500 [Elainellaceae cyanobacterium]